jgi:hypothetical protein
MHLSQFWFRVPGRKKARKAACQLSNPSFGINGFIEINRLTHLLKLCNSRFSGFVNVLPAVTIPGRFRDPRSCGFPFPTPSLPSLWSPLWRY